VFVIQHPEGFEPERAYVLDVVLTQRLGLTWTAKAEARSDVLFGAAEPREERRLAISDCLFATPQADWLTPASLPARPLDLWDTAEAPIAPTLVTAQVPVLYGARLRNGSFFEENETETRLGVDIFGSVFFQLARYEELAIRERDEHARFPAHVSLAQLEGFLSRPLADEYVEILFATIKRLWPTSVRKPRTFTEQISHDVDSHLYRAASVPAALRTALGDVARRRDPGLAASRLRSSFGRPDPTHNPYNSFELIMDLSEERGVRSSFNFIAGTSSPGQDGTYDITDSWIGDLIKRIHERGHEVGLHPSYNTFKDPELIAGELFALTRTCESLGIDQRPLGGRQHYLRFETPTTWRGWEQAGLDYDSTLGFPRDPGFRCGTCIEYPVFDLLDRRGLRLYERPLIVMEMAVLDKAGLSEQDAALEFQHLRERCRLFGGQFTLLWHNSRLAHARDRRIYAAVMRQHS
jgi:hypothetical protein